ncbi:hypothetical protein [Massilia glaciei]|uniref:Uncharacterized protein n=1 Tax=Massilia glaciei TaxID=1524097 RepID=A0A2U2HLV7_9BURK|nr:hypothetical protein [Massilia glaciei]PWF48416.1 hypothetical protein C7C56_011895 [Massilia glaciei]
MTSTSYELLRKKGYALAGELGDLRRRACVYHHLYADSGKRSVFPLIAAHGALWACGYFKKGMLGGRVISLRYLLSPGARRAKLQAIADFADKFRDINRRVCAEAYAIYHYTKLHGGDGYIRGVIGDAFADILCACHESNQRDSHFSREQRKTLFMAFLCWEQEHIVAPAVARAFDAFDNGLIKYLARRPTIAFAYFGSDFRLRFKDFSSHDERIERGLQAYRRAEDVGFVRVERALGHYKLMPADFHLDPDSSFQAIALAHA